MKNGGNRNAMLVTAHGRLLLNQTGFCKTKTHLRESPSHKTDATDSSALVDTGLGGKGNELCDVWNGAARANGRMACWGAGLTLRSLRFECRPICTRLCNQTAA